VARFLDLQTDNEHPVGRGLRHRGRGAF
jgi:hypothetical protein